MTPKEILEATRSLDDSQFLLLISILRIEEEERRKRLIEKLEAQTKR